MVVIIIIFLFKYKCVHKTSETKKKCWGRKTISKFFSLFNKAIKAEWSNLGLTILIKKDYDNVPFMLQKHWKNGIKMLSHDLIEKN